MHFVSNLESFGGSSILKLYIHKRVTCDEAKKRILKESLDEYDPIHFQKVWYKIHWFWYHIFEGIFCKYVYWVQCSISVQSCLCPWLACKDGSSLILCISVLIMCNTELEDCFHGNIFIYFSISRKILYSLMFEGNKYWNKHSV